MAPLKEIPMSNLYEMFSTDPDLEKNGIALEYGKGITIVVARAGGSNQKYQTCVQTKLRPYRAQMQNNVLDPDVANRLLAEAFSETIILAWTGVKDSSGKELKFSKYNVVKLLTDLPELFEDIQTQTTGIANFHAGPREEDAKS